MGIVPTHAGRQHAPAACGPSGRGAFFEFLANLLMIVVANVSIMLTVPEGQPGEDARS
jgi:hypothetical protein